MFGADVRGCGNLFPGVARRGFFFNVIIENVATDGINRTKSLLSKRAEQQFEELLLAKPHILQRVPQRYIAQYLGVAPESLSRIRKRLATSGKS